MILMGCYNSNLFAFLAVDNSPMPFDSIESIVENNDYRVGYVSGSAYSESLQVPVIQDLRISISKSNYLKYNEMPFFLF